MKGVNVLIGLGCLVGAGVAATVVEEAIIKPIYVKTGCKHGAIACAASIGVRVGAAIGATAAYSAITAAIGTDESEG